MFTNVAGSSETSPSTVVPPRRGTGSWHRFAVAPPRPFLPGVNHDFLTPPPPSPSSEIPSVSPFMYSRAVVVFLRCPAHTSIQESVLTLFFVTAAAKKLSLNTTRVHKMLQKQEEMKA